MGFNKRDEGENAKVVAAVVAAAASVVDAAVKCSSEAGRHACCTSAHTVPSHTSSHRPLSHFLTPSPLTPPHTPSHVTHLQHRTPPLDVTPLCPVCNAVNCLCLQDGSSTQQQRLTGINAHGLHSRQNNTDGKQEKSGVLCACVCVVCCVVWCVMWCGVVFKATGL